MNGFLGEILNGFLVLVRELTGGKRRTGRRSEKYTPLSDVVEGDRRAHVENTCHERPSLAQTVILDPMRPHDIPTSYIPAFTLEPVKKAAEPRRDPSPPSDPRTPGFLQDIASGRVELPTIPRVVQKLISALRNPHVDSRLIGDALSKDPVLSAKVLRLANSSFFGGQRSMSSIDVAVAMIGTAALNRLIMACGVSTSFEDVPGIDLKVYWREAMVAATAANKLAATVGADSEEAYVCGLLHATGHLILCTSYPDVATAMFTGFAPVFCADLAAIELEAFGIDHATVSALWVESLGFPKSVSEAIGKTARPLPVPPKPIDLALHAACSLAADVSQEFAAELALSKLPAQVKEKFMTPDGKPDKAFMKIYDELLEAEPIF